MKIKADNRFKKSFKKWSRKHPDLAKFFKEKLILFQNSPFDTSLKTHSLGGYLKDFWAISINYEHRLIFKFMKPDEVLLIDIGTHDEVY